MLGKSAKIFPHVSVATAMEFKAEEGRWEDSEDERHVAGSINLLFLTSTRKPKWRRKSAPRVGGRPSR